MILPDRVSTPYGTARERMRARTADGQQTVLQLVTVAVHDNLVALNINNRTSWDTTIYTRVSVSAVRYLCSANI